MNLKTNLTLTKNSLHFQRNTYNVTMPKYKYKKRERISPVPQEWLLDGESNIWLFVPCLYLLHVIGKFPLFILYVETS